jgi:hypothetical protein
MFGKIPWKDVCKFLAGAFFVSAGVLLYLYMAGVSVPVLGVPARSSSRWWAWRRWSRGRLPRLGPAGPRRTRGEGAVR